MIDAVDPSTKPRRAPAVAVAPSDGAAVGLIRRHWSSVRRYLRILGADATLADDLAQDAFVIALRKGLEDRGGQTAAWLRRTARNLLLDHGRRRQPLSLEVAEVVWEERGEDGDERQQALRDCLPLLTERSQTAVRLAYGERRSRLQIAAALDMRASAVKTLLRRCRATLKQCIERATATGQEDSR